MDRGDAVEEVPLGEASEAYEVDVLDGAGTVVRTFTSAEVDLVTNPRRAARLAPPRVLA